MTAVYIILAIAAALFLLSLLRVGVHIAFGDELRVTALAGAIDPAGAAELYGYINAGMWTVMPQLEKLTRMPDPRIHTEIDFDASELKVSGEVGLSFQIRDFFAIGWAFARPLLRWFMAMRKRKKAAIRAKAAEERAAARDEHQASKQGAEHTTT